MHKPPAFILRVMLTALVVAYGLTLYLQWHLTNLSVEAEQYRQVVSTSMSGFSLAYGLEKLCWILGNIVGALGIASMFYRRRSGLPLLLASPPLLSIAAVLGAPPAAYPGIERMPAMVLWCVSSAIWGCVVTYALAGEGKILLSTTTGEASSGPPAEPTRHRG